MATCAPVRLASIADRIEIAPSVTMPRLGLGTSHALGNEAEAELHAGFALGYRGIDTAAMYGNEAEVGVAIRESGLERTELFVATKVWNSDQGYRSTLDAFERSLARLGLSHVDLYLIHWPQPRHTRDTWRALEELHAAGRARAIGVCNFTPALLDDLLSFARIPPAVDQVELHPRLPQRELRAYCAAHGITVQAWSPLLRGAITRIPELADIGERYGKTAAQVTLRWILQCGMTTIPKSVHPERLAENADIFDFELTMDDIQAIEELGTAQRIGARPSTMARLSPFMRFVKPPH
jgi:diketogulonate reductase-like aldo/keto reductase